MNSTNRYITKVRKKVGKAINRYTMIGADDKIIVGISGGKDSLVLLETLAERRRFIPIDYTLYAVHINVSAIGYDIELSFIESLCKKLNVQFVHKKVSNDLLHGGQSPCFVCSSRRRSELFNLAHELGCSKLALGHHMDDMVETMLLNMIYQGNYSTMPPKLSLFGGEMEIIRPLAFLTNDELVRYAQLRKFVLEKKPCPYKDDTKRNEVRKLVDQCQDMYDRARYNLFYSMSNIHHDYLP